MRVWGGQWRALKDFRLATDAVNLVVERLKLQVQRRAVSSCQRAACRLYSQFTHTLQQTGDLLQPTLGDLGQTDAIGEVLDQAAGGANGRSKACANGQTCGVVACRVDPQAG